MGENNASLDGIKYNKICIILLELLTTLQVCNVGFSFIRV